MKSKDTNYLDSQMIDVIIQQLTELKKNGNIAYFSITSLPGRFSIDISYSTAESEEE